MNSQGKILYEHLKDYPTFSEGHHEVGNRAVPPSSPAVKIGFAK